MKTRHLLSVAIWVMLVITIFCTTASAAVPNPSDLYYVYDEAGVISEDSEEYIVSQNSKLQYSTGAQIVIAAVKTTDGVSISDYASEMYTEWNIGDSEKMNGVLILLVIDDDNYWVVQGSGIENELTSGEIRVMFDNCLEPYFAEKDYDRGAVGIFDMMLTEFEEIYDIKLGEVAVPDSGADSADGEGTSAGFVVLIVFLVIIAVAIVAIIVFIVIRNISENKYRSGAYRPNVTIPPGAKRPPNPQNRLPANSQRPRGAMPRPNNAPRPNGNMQRPGGTMPRPNGNPRPSGTPRPSGNPQRPDGGNKINRH